jgi:hypothetical protein
VAGIIAGRDDVAPTHVQKGESDNFVGMAPDARIVSAKVADAYGLADISQVIAAIDWVVQHRQNNGMNIRVLDDGTAALVGMRDIFGAAWNGMVWAPASLAGRCGRAGSGAGNAGRPNVGVATAGRRPGKP